MPSCTWEEFNEKLKGCQCCELCYRRTNIVPGEGNVNADVMFIGEGPGHDEDLAGRPFVGAAGKLLDKMLAAIELDRNTVYIANIVKCRPPENRAPTDEEAKMCIHFLRAQFVMIKPKIIVCLGATSAKYVYDPNVRIMRDRGVWKEKNGVYILPTFHPAALLRDESKKKFAWEDMKLLRAKIEELSERG